jgi:ATP-dependent RNA helicase DeaD
MTRFFINIGRKDSLNPGKLIGLINEQNIGNKVEIGSIDILDTFSFFEIDKNYEEKTLEAFQNNSPDFEGRSVNIEITKKDRSRGGRGGNRRGKKPFGKSNDGGFGRRRSGGSSDRKPRAGGDRPDRSSSDKRIGGFGRRRRER